MVHFPPLFEENMKKLLSEDGWKAYTATFEHDYWQGLRVNLSKITPEQYKERRRLQTGEDLERVPWCPSGFYLKGETSAYSKSPDYFAGLFYLQEPSAMAPAQILPIEDRKSVV